MVELDLVRGYPLPFDPADPAVKKVGTYKVINAEEINRSPSSASTGNPSSTNTLPKNLQDNKSNGYSSDGEGIRRDARLGGIVFYFLLCIWYCYRDNIMSLSNLTLKEDFKFE